MEKTKRVRYRTRKVKGFDELQRKTITKEMKEKLDKWERAFKEITDDYVITNFLSGIRAVGILKIPGDHGEHKKCNPIIVLTTSCNADYSDVEENCSKITLEEAKVLRLCLGRIIRIYEKRKKG